jgi:hypothetical protein
MRCSLFICFVCFVIVSCTGDPVVAELNNPLDHENENYIEPGINTIAGLSPDLTLNNNAITVNWEGSSPDLLYWASLTGSEMTADGEGAWVFLNQQTSLEINFLNEGQHTLKLKAKYTNDHADSYIDSIPFAIDALTPNSLWLYPTRVFADSSETFRISLMTDEWTETFISGSISFESTPNVIELTRVTPGELVPPGSFFYEHNDDYLSSGALLVDFGILSDPPTLSDVSGEVLALDFRLLKDIQFEEIITLGSDSELRDSDNDTITITNAGEGMIYQVKIMPR